MDIKISTIIPTYKRPHLLLKCLHALVNQSLAPEDFEVIVVCDGPDKETWAQVEAFVSKLPIQNVFCSYLPIKRGPAAARNYGASKAQGSLLAFTDDDCEPQSDWLSSLYRAWETSSENEIAFTGKTIVPRNDPPTDYEKNIAQLETAEFITANCACTTAAFRKTGGFDERFPIAWREDSDLHFKLLTNGIPIRKINDALVVHPVRKAPWGISIKEQRKGVYDVLLHKKHPLLYKKQIKEKPSLNYYAIVLCTLLAILCLIENQKKLFLVFALSSSFFITSFAAKRLTGTSKKTTHLLEIALTSIAIPFVSVYWRLRGSLRYKKLLL